MTKKVFVSGCYDMLHSGHVAFFEEAATHGDLYVGLGKTAMNGKRAAKCNFPGQSANHIQIPAALVAVCL